MTKNENYQLLLITMKVMRVFLPSIRIIDYGYMVWLQNEKLRSVQILDFFEDFRFKGVCFRFTEGRFQEEKLIKSFLLLDVQGLPDALRKIQEWML